VTKFSCIFLSFSHFIKQVGHPKQKNAIEATSVGESAVFGIQPRVSSMSNQSCRSVRHVAIVLEEVDTQGEAQRLIHVNPKVKQNQLPNWRRGKRTEKERSPA
jgi:hypothetical protein